LPLELELEHEALGLSLVRAIDNFDMRILTTITLQPFGLAALSCFNAARVVSRNINNLLDGSQ
jgi:hypothetical protein